MEKRVVFNERWLPYLLVAPQMIITLVFFFWPSAQAMWQSVLVEDAFGGNSKFVWFANFTSLLSDPNYYDSVRVTLVFSALVTSIGLAISLLLAVMADRIVRGATIYKTILIWPYAVAPAIAGVLWGFLFNPSVGIVVWLLHGIGIDFNYVMNGNQALLLVVIAAVWSQLSYNFLFFLAGLQSIPKSLIEAAAIDGAGPWRTLLTIILPNSKPVFASVAILSFLSSWSSFLWPVMMVDQPNVSPLPLQIAVFQGQTPVNWGEVCAFGVLMVAPVVVIFIAFQRWFVRGVTASAVKG